MHCTVLYCTVLGITMYDQVREDPPESVVMDIIHQAKVGVNKDDIDGNC